MSKENIIVGDYMQVKIIQYEKLLVNKKFYQQCFIDLAKSTMHYALCTMHCIKSTIHYALCIMHYALFTIHYALNPAYVLKPIAIFAIFICIVAIGFAFIQHGGEFFTDGVYGYFGGGYRCGVFCGKEIEEVEFI